MRVATPLQLSQFLRSPKSGRRSLDFSRGSDDLVTEYRGVQHWHGLPAPPELGGGPDVRIYPAMQ